MALDVPDIYVTYNPNEDLWDGANISINDRVRHGADLNLLSYPLKFQVGASGELVTHDSLTTLMAQGTIKAALALKPGTTVDTVGDNFDQGYTFEMSVYLPDIGYPLDLGDRALYFGVDIYDGDRPFGVSTDRYATRTWFFRERENLDGPCVAYLSPYPANTAGVDGPGSMTYALLGNFPNPYRGTTTVHYRMPLDARVTLDLYDVAGRLVSSRALGIQRAGEGTVSLSSAGRRPGVYPYRVRIEDAHTGAHLRTLSGRMVVLD